MLRRLQKRHDPSFDTLTTGNRVRRRSTVSHAILAASAILLIVVVGYLESTAHTHRTQIGTLDFDSLPKRPIRETTWRCWKTDGGEWWEHEVSGSAGLDLLSMQNEVRGGVCLVQNVCFGSGRLKIMQSGGAAATLQPGVVPGNPLIANEHVLSAEHIQEEGANWPYVPGLSTLIFMAGDGLQHHIAHWLEKVAVIAALRNHVPAAQPVPSVIALFNHPSELLDMQKLMLSVALNVKGMFSRDDTKQYVCPNEAQESLRYYDHHSPVPAKHAAGCKWKDVPKPQILYQGDWNALGLQARELGRSFINVWKSIRGDQKFLRAEPICFEQAILPARDFSFFNHRVDAAIFAKRAQVFANNMIQTAPKPDIAVLIERRTTKHTLQNSILQASGKRLMLNAEEVHDTVRAVTKSVNMPLTPRLVSFETLNAAEQVVLLGRTALLMGFHGAAHANAVFMQPRTAILEMFPYKFLDYRFMDFNIASGRTWMPWHNRHRNLTFMPEPDKYKEEYELLDDSQCVAACARYCYANRRDADTLVSVKEVAVVVANTLECVKNGKTKVGRR